MKILVVDDDEVRLNVIVDLLIDRCLLTKDQVDTATCSTVARRKIRNDFYDLLILDVILPKVDVNPSANNGLELLESLSTKGNLNKPTNVIGITASVNDIASFKDKFNELCFQVIEATNRTFEWKDKIVNSVNYLKSSLVRRDTAQKKFVCISVHGIQTNGNWQGELQKEIGMHVNDVDFQSFNYGYFTLISFLIPFLRLKVIRRLKYDLLKEYSGLKGKNVVFVAHSFGTYVLMKALEGIDSKDLPFRLHTIVLCGSVLKKEYDLSTVIEKFDTRIVNECGISDNVLLFSEMFVVNTGMAGRVGFYGLNNSRFINRFHQGGHSLYFNSYFFEKYWLNIFRDEQGFVQVDDREDGVITKNIIENPISLLAKFKEVFYILMLVWGVIKIF
ncbi:MAG: response regulator [Oleispira sp.]